jgi:predicted dinucleotide-binding enzyme
MKIGIISAGQIGGTLTRRFTALGYDVAVANSRGPEPLAELAAETDAKAVSVKDAAKFGEVVVVTIPEKNIPELPRDLFAETPKRVVVIDTGNYYPLERDGRIDAIEAGLTESRWVAQQLKRPVVKAFNNIRAEHLLKLGEPKGTRRRIAFPVAGDDRLDIELLRSFVADDRRLFTTLTADTLIGSAGNDLFFSGQLGR